jgi:hypothetical protein
VLREVAREARHVDQHAIYGGDVGQVVGLVALLQT